MKRRMHVKVQQQVKCFPQEAGTSQCQAILPPFFIGHFSCLRTHLLLLISEMDCFRMRPMLVSGTPTSHDKQQHPNKRKCMKLEEMVAELSLPFNTD